MKKLLIVVAACGSSKPVVAPPPPEPPIATRGPDKTEPPLDAADRKHAFTRTPDQLRWDGDKAKVGPDQSFIKVRAGSAFDVTGGPAVVVAGTVKNASGQQLHAWANQPHKIECLKGTDCVIFLDTSAQPEPMERTTLEWEKDIATLWQDSKAGPVGFFMKLKPGAGPFWHIHRRDYHGVVIAGTVVSYESGKEPTEMGPGSYWWQPNGNKHTTDCKGPAECIVYMDFTGAYDVKAVP